MPDAAVNPYPLLSRTSEYDASGARVGLKPTKVEAANAKYRTGVAPLSQTWGYQLGQMARPLFTGAHGGIALQPFNNPVTGAAAGAIPAALTGYGLTHLFNRIAPVMTRGIAPELSPSRVSMLLALLGAGAGAYLGHTRRGYMKQSSMMLPPQWSPFMLPTTHPGMMPMPMLVPMPATAAAAPPQEDPFAEIASAIEQSSLPPSVKLQALTAVPNLPPRESNALASLVGGVSGAMAGAVVTQFLTSRGLLPASIGALGGALLGSRIGSHFG